MARDKFNYWAKEMSTLLICESEGISISMGKSILAWIKLVIMEKISVDFHMY